MGVDDAALPEAVSVERRGPHVAACIRRTVIFAESITLVWGGVWSRLDAFTSCCGEAEDEGADYRTFHDVSFRDEW